MSNRDHNTRRNWHARPADGAPEITHMIGDIEYTHNPQAREDAGPFVYDAYGFPVDLSPLPSDAEDYSLNELFQGIQHDPDHPWFMDRHRAFHPKVQPWVNTEPMAYVDGLNVHAAMADNPMIAIDPQGT